MKINYKTVDFVVKWFLRTAINQSPHSPVSKSSIAKERERERETHTHTHTHTYIYIYKTLKSLLKNISYINFDSPSDETVNRSPLSLS